MPRELVRAAFLDRDGVINAEFGYVHRLEDFHLLPGVPEGLLVLEKCGYALVIVTNQAGIAKGLYREQEYQRLTQHMLQLLNEYGVRPRGVYFCPHHPKGVVKRYSVECVCRKPAPGMLLQAATDHGLDLSKSVIVGDKTSDAAAGRSAGVGLAVLVASGHPLPADASQHADYCCDDLLAAAHWIQAKQGLV